MVIAGERCRRIGWTDSGFYCGASDSQSKRILELPVFAV